MPRGRNGVQDVQYRKDARRSQAARRPSAAAQGARAAGCTQPHIRPRPGAPPRSSAGGRTSRRSAAADTGPVHPIWHVAGGTRRREAIGRRPAPTRVATTGRPSDRCGSQAVGAMLSHFPCRPGVQQPSQIASRRRCATQSDLSKEHVVVGRLLDCPGRCPGPWGTRAARGLPARRPAPAIQCGSRGRGCPVRPPVVIQIDNDGRHVAHDNRLLPVRAEADRLAVFQDHAMLIRRAALR